MKKTIFLIFTILALLLSIAFAFTACESEHVTNNDNNICQHSWIDATCEAPKTCSICNTTQGAALGHSWINATCEAPKTCSVCNTTQGAALAHSWINATCEAPKTCSVCNTTQGAALGHSWINATCEAPKTCSVCNKTNGKANGHNMVSGFCSKCGHTTLKIKDVLSAPITDHDKVAYLAGDNYVYSGGNFRIGVNSADGLYLMWAAKNLTSKDIKYLTFTVEFFNSVDDPAYDKITGKSSTTIQLIGPITKNNSFLYRKIIGYSTSCSYIVITNISIEYMDGTKVSGNYGYSTKGEYVSNFSNTPEKYTSKYVG